MMEQTADAKIEPYAYWQFDAKMMNRRATKQREGKKGLSKLVQVSCFYNLTPAPSGGLSSLYSFTHYARTSHKRLVWCSLSASLNRAH
jgi:hypothetical protein